jgi:hypothetical protein
VRKSLRRQRHQPLQRSRRPVPAHPSLLGRSRTQGRSRRRRYLRSDG